MVELNSARQQLKELKKENNEIENELTEFNSQIDSFLQKKIKNNDEMMLANKNNEKKLKKSLKTTENLIIAHLSEIESHKKEWESIKYISYKLEFEVNQLKNQLKALENENKGLLISAKTLENEKLSNFSETIGTKNELLTLIEKEKELVSLLKTDKEKITSYKNQLSQDYLLSNQHISIKDEIENLKSKNKDLKNLRKREENGWKNIFQQLELKIAENKLELLKLEDAFKIKNKACRVSVMKAKAAKRTQNLKSKTPDIFDFKQ